MRFTGYTFTLEALAKALADLANEETKTYNFSLKGEQAELNSRKVSKDSAWVKLLQRMFPGISDNAVARNVPKAYELYVKKL